MSADVLKLQEEIKRVEVKLDQMTFERDALMDRLKVIPRFMLVFVQMNVMQYYFLFLAHIYLEYTTHWF